jgi:hypothetical protein
MNSMPQILARLTVAGIATLELLMLWLVIRRGAVQSAISTQRRRTTRHSLLLPVEVGGKKAGKGLTTDVSLGGCKINGNFAVQGGQHFTLQLHLPWKESPIVVERAAVRWVAGTQYGFQFLSLRSNERDRLQKLLQLA